MVGPIGSIKRARSFEVENSASNRQRVHEPIPAPVVNSAEFIQQLIGVAFEDLGPGSEIKDRLEHLSQAIAQHDFPFQSLWEMGADLDPSRELYVTLPKIENPTEHSDYAWLHIQMFRNEPGYHISIREYAYTPEGEQTFCLAKLTCDPDGKRLGFQSLEDGYDVEKNSILTFCQSLFPTCDIEVNTFSLSELLLSLTGKHFEDPGPTKSLTQRLQVLAGAMHGNLSNPSERMARLLDLATVIASPNEANRNYHQLYVTLPLRADSDLDEDQLWLQLTISDPKDKYWSSLIAPEAISNSESQSYYRLTLEQYAYTDEGQNTINLQDLRVDTKSQLTELSMLTAGHRLSGTNVMILYDLFASGSQQILVDMAVKTMEIPALAHSGSAFTKDFRMNRVSAFVKGMTWYASKGFEAIPCAKLLSNDGDHRFSQHPPYLRAAINHVRTLSLQTFWSKVLIHRGKISAQRVICDRHAIDSKTARTCDLVGVVFSAALSGQAQALHDFSTVYDQVCSYENVSNRGTEARVYKMALEAIHAHVVFMREASDEILGHAGGKDLPSWSDLVVNIRKKNSKIKAWTDVVALINESDLPSTLPVYN